MTGRQLLASSGTADGLRGLVRRYVADPSAVVELADGGAVVVSGRPLVGVRWRVTRGRWRLEAADTGAES